MIEWLYCSLSAADADDDKKGRTQNAGDAVIIYTILHEASCRHFIDNSPVSVFLTLRVELRVSC